MRDGAPASAVASIMQISPPWTDGLPLAVKVGCGQALWREPAPCATWRGGSADQGSRTPLKATSRNVQPPIVATSRANCAAGHLRLSLDDGKQYHALNSRRGTRTGRPEFPVFPVWLLDNDKVPAITGWRHGVDRRQQIQGWFTGARYLIGTPTGRANGISDAARRRPATRRETMARRE